MIYKIVIEKKPQKFIAKQDKSQQARIYNAIYKLPNGDVKKLQTKQDFYRYGMHIFLIINCIYLLYIEHNLIAQEKVCTKSTI